jgi:hypothetical protein
VPPNTAPGKIVEEDEFETEGENGSKTELEHNLGYPVTLRSAL